MREGERRRGSKGKGKEEHLAVVNPLQLNPLQLNPKHIAFMQSLWLPIGSTLTLFFPLSLPIALNQIVETLHLAKNLSVAQMPP